MATDNEFNPNGLIDMFADLMKPQPYLAMTEIMVSRDNGPMVRVFAGETPSQALERRGDGMNIICLIPRLQG